MDEHQKKLEAKSGDSHAQRHLQEEYGDMDLDHGNLSAYFGWKVLKRCKSAFERSILEVVLIQENSATERSLNSKDE